MCADFRGQRGKTSSPMTDAKLRHFIANFSFNNCKHGSQGFQRILLQLFGYVGHGKSSFVNTCIMVWRNSSYVNYASAAGSHESHTTQRLTYPLTENLTLVDNRGCSAMNYYETGEIFAQLANLLPLDKPVGWSKGFTLADRIVEAEVHVQTSDFIVPIFVYSVRKSMAPGELEELKEMLKTCRNLTGVAPIVVLSHKDDERLHKVQIMFRDIGIENFFSLENYTEKRNKYSQDTHESVIRFLFEVVKDAEFRVNDKRDPDAEMAERKFSVLKYIHEREIKIHREGLERRRAEENKEHERELRRIREEAERQRQEDRQRHEEGMRRMEEEFKQQCLRDDIVHEHLMHFLQKKKKKKK
ncbi:uncharacterized protein, partial [Pyxicephalus adspersus]|uniref:uncharacterized protein n=1 Tax=Pyxicephalus adspersus TaxID=30357 RepID=UPI003B5A09CD